MDFKEQITKLKIHFEAFNYNDLANKLGISENAIKQWSKKKEIPKKYIKYIELDKNTPKSVLINENENKINEENILSESINPDVMSKNIYKMCKILNNKDILEIFQLTFQKWAKQNRENQKEKQ